MAEEIARRQPRLPTGMKMLVGFFAFGATMCALTIVLLLWPATLLGALWGLNPDAHTAFQSLGPWAVILMLVVGSACATAAIGLARQKTWARWVAISILAVNLVGDLINAVMRHDLRTLIGVPIAGVLIVYLTDRRSLRGFWIGRRRSYPG